MADGFEDVDPSVGFLYKTMLHRDPRKRRVKPVQKHLLQLDFGGLEDSSDDSDFEVVKGASGEEDSDPEVEKSASQSESEDEEDKDNEDEEEDEKEENGSEDTEMGMTVDELLERAKQKTMEIKKLGSEETNTSGSSARLRVVICCVCLGDVSEEDDEIVECDGCGVSVHEGCYGISESQSVASTESSASTEPWFCDACKAGTKPHCELCPNFGGIYKETDAGKWVHIVCALYIPGVAFGDVDRLSPVTLFEMPYSKWGARECVLCEDERFSRTGVVIGCDAGMCRNYFHVTCAQREGLLSEASPEEDIADPFYAYCKQHADKASVRARRRNWLAIQSHWKQHKDINTQDENEKLRVQRKLNRHRQKYLAAKAKRPPAWVPKEKVPRLLTTSTSAMRRLMRKAELLGINTQVQNTGSKDIRKKWHVAPALSVEFVGYYLDRNVRMNSMKGHLHELLSQREKLQEQEQILRIKYDQLLADVEKLKESTTGLRHKGEDVWHQLSDLAGKPLPLPEVIKPKKVVRSPRKDVPRSPPAVIHQCGICHKTTDQHRLAKCDACRKYYHLGCLDPPLSRMPKKTKLCGWQCSECAGSSSDEPVSKVADPKGPMKLREKIKIKEPVKFTPPIIKKKGVKGRRKKRLFKKRQREEPVEEEEKEMPVLKKERPYRTPKLVKQKDVRTECAVCLKPGDNSNLVRCDECKLCYHFHCLDPPLRKSPKQRGYAWHCTACDPTEAELEAEDVEDDIAVDDEDDEEDEHLLYDECEEPLPDDGDLELISIEPEPEDSDAEHKESGGE